jgi:DNA polymerase-3 subunit beta
MDVVVKRGAFLKCLQNVQGIVEKRNTIPILANILLDSKEDRLCIKATDLDIEIVLSVPATVNTRGTTTVLATTMIDIIRKLPEGDVFLVQKDDTIVITCKNSKFSLKTLSASDFPVMATDTFSHEFSMDPKVLYRLLDKSRFAMSTEETRYYLNGVFFHTVQQGDDVVLRAVSTDGHRLARVEAPAPKDLANAPRVIIPRKTVGELHKFLDKNEEEHIHIHISSTKIQFSSDHFTLKSKVVDGTFPDYQSVIPAKNTNHLRVSPMEFLHAVDRAATVAAEKTRAVKLSLDTDSLEISV